MKKTLLRLTSVALKGAGFLFCLYLGILLLAIGFKFSTHLLTGISPGDFDLQKYRTPDPDPSKNFFSVFAYDFERPSNGMRYVPREMPSYGPYPGAIGKTREENSSRLNWPWTKDFSDYFDLDASAKALREISQVSGLENTPESAAHRVKILAASTSLDTCDRAISIWRPFFKRLYAGLILPESLYSIPFAKAFTLNGPSTGIIEPIRIAKAMNFDSLVSFARQRPAVEVQNTLVGLRLGEGFLNRPVGMVFQIVGLACISITLPVIWKGIDGDLFNENDLVRIQDQLSRLHPMQNGVTAMNQDFALAYCRNVSDLPFFNNPKGRFLSFWLKPVGANLFQGLVVLELNKVRQAMRKNRSFFKEEGSPWDVILPTARALSLHNSAKFEEIKLQLTRLDVALKIFQLRKGKLPDSLSELTPSILKDLPLDPLTNVPFHYKKVGPNKYVIYSSWVDGIDDGGTPVKTASLPPEKLGQYYFQDAKGDFVWPQHHATSN